MYIVQWCDHEGNLHENLCKTARAAHAEAEYRRNTYDWVQVIPVENEERPAGRSNT